MTVGMSRADIAVRELVETLLTLVWAKVVDDHEDKPGDEPVWNEEDDQELDEAEEEVRVGAVEFADAYIGFS
jgi:hypothetical protein